jgi:hypothetical protein
LDCIEVQLSEVMVTPIESDFPLRPSRPDAQAVEAVRAHLSNADATSFLDRTTRPAGQPGEPFVERELTLKHQDFRR